MSKQISKKENTEVSMTVNAIGGGLETFGSLIKLPRLSVMQKTSKPVEEGLAKIGDLFENLGNTVVCEKDKPFTFVPILIKSLFVKYKPEGTKYVYASHQDMNAKLEKHPWEQVEGGITYRYRPEIQVYLFDYNSLKNNEMVLPYLFTFRGASMPAGGKALYTASLLLQAQKQPYCLYQFVMTNKKMEKDGNTYQVTYVNQPKEKVNPEYLTQIEMWRSTLLSMSNVEIAEDIEETTTTNTGEAF